MGRAFFNRSGRFMRRLGYRCGSHAAYLLARRAFNQNDHVTRLRVPHLPHPIFLRGTSSDLEAMEHVFVQRQYEFAHWREHHAAVERAYHRVLADRKCPVIVDCGANVGYASIWFALKYPGATILAIEPEPQNFAILGRNAASYPNIRPILAGVSDRAGRISLQNPRGEAWAWQTVEDDQGPVTAIAINDLLAQIPRSAPLIVKVDIEGHESQLFRSNTEWVERTPLIVCELHDWMLPWRGSANAILRSLTQQPRDFLMQGEAVFSFARPPELPAEYALAPSIAAHDPDGPAEVTDALRDR
jgi:FkbM family methyltransferase